MDKPVDLLLGDRGPFVDRAAEKACVAGKLEAGVRGARMPSAVLCFWGAFGMGKSRLLRELRRCMDPGSFPGLLASLGRASAVNALGCPPAAALVDLDRTRRADLWEGKRLIRERLLRELWEQLAEQGAIAAPQRPQESPQVWADELVRELSQAQRRTPVLMLDTVDELLSHDEESFFWLEEQVVERLALHERILFVFASRSELRRFRRFQVRRRVELHRLTALDAQQTGEEAQANTIVGRALYAETSGHPWATARLRDLLEENGVDLTKAQEMPAAILEPLSRDVLEAAVSEMAGAEARSDLYRYASVHRWLSAEVLRALAESQNLAPKGNGDAYYTDLITAFQAQHLLYFDPTHRCYEPDPTLRRLAGRWIELTNPDLYRQTHSAAVTFHRTHLDQHPEYLARYVPELAYHQILLSPHEAQPPLQEWWARFLQSKAPENVQAWDELHDALKDDEELKRLLPSEDYQALWSAAQDRCSHPSDGAGGA